MRKLSLIQMENFEGGGWLAAACGVGLMSLQASFAFPLLFAITTPLTVSACVASGIQAAIKAGY